MRISSRARNDDGKCNDFGCEGNENVMKWIGEREI